MSVAGNPRAWDGVWFRRASVLALILCASAPVFAQNARGELHLRVLDFRGDPLLASVELVSEANQVLRQYRTGVDGRLAIRELPLGIYHLKVFDKGFIPSQQLVTLRSEVPLNLSVTLGIAPVRSRIRVTDSATLLDTEQAGTAYAVGSRALQQSLPAQMGRGLMDLVNQEPGWLYEANGVLHPRGSENGVQYIVNGIPLTENRSPAFAPPFDSGNVESMRIMTSGFPAEYGRKLGGVVEIISQDDTQRGFHLTASGEGGSFATADGSVQADYKRGTNLFAFSGEGGVTDRYLDPPVMANYTNHGSTGGFTTSYARNLSNRSRLRFSFHHAQVDYLVPNEQVQQEAGQRQDGMDVETSGQADYSLVLTPNLLFRAAGSLRDESFRLESNRFATPVRIAQQRGFRQGYGRLALAGQSGAHDWKIGADVIVRPVHEALNYVITNPAQFDPGTALNFAFQDRRDDVEPAAFVEDAFHHRHWNLRLGLRFDNYSFVVHQSAWSPRVAVSRYFPSLGVLVHASYDRVFQTPAMENLLLASSPQVQQLNSLVVRLQVEPARANYYEVGFTKGLWGKIRLDANLFRRSFRNYPDDDTLLNTGVSIPIADASAWIEGVESKLELPRWGRFSGFISYSNQEGVGQGPIVGGLLIGAQAIADVPGNSRFWVSQDQRNTARSLLRYQATRRLWLATSSTYGSGLPVELDTGDVNYNFLLAQYGPQVLSQVDFQGQRVRPSYSIGAAAGFDLYNKDARTLSLQVQSSNLTNHLNIINFASLFSGTAISTPRSFGARVEVGF